ncbi:BTB/POZ domain-containing protein 2-like [Paramacrobiotus metropolitanus]|uniref:BTB/POZ domain-containing protein 2-like n=1 Tax=Paramacrobiotus metropolitanus TaxID=2943436 RepID=UPI002445FA7A|nr:BTB/POZ domain-containing protein 2-like [Paramacrobiotus metropolitanus]
MSNFPLRSTEASVPRRGTIEGALKRWEQMLKSGDLSDVQFSVGRYFGPARIFEAHKLVLSSASDVFYTMFNGSLPENRDDAIDVPEISPPAFENMLKYIYADKADVTVENVFPTMKCADKYDLPFLGDFCFGFFMQDLIPEFRDADCYLLHLENALMWAVGIESVVENCLHFVDVHSKIILRSERFTELQYNTLRAILERDTLFAEESLICMAVDRWAVAACTRSNLEPSAVNRRQVLGELFYLIRFPVMTVMQLTEMPAESGFLEASALVEIFHHRHRFNALPRRQPVIRVGDMEFKHQEEVFVFKPPYCTPAHVIGSRGSTAVCVPLEDEDDDEDDDDDDDLLKLSPEQLIRAADYCTLHQPVFFCRSEVKYIRSENGRHIVAGSNREYKVNFSEICLEYDQAIAWRKTIANGSGKAPSVSTGKRSLDAAGLSGND